MIIVAINKEAQTVRVSPIVEVILGINATDKQPLYSFEKDELFSVDGLQLMYRELKGETYVIHI